MAILVDYRCAACGVRAEHWQPSPPPASVLCASCGAESRRLFAAVGLSGSTAAPPPTAAAPARRGPKLCARYPQIPGLCHMSESAGRMWVAKYLKDGRAVDREQQRQEEAAAVAPPKLEDAITHQHVDAPTAPAAAPSS
jgi:putative FmdB family regulatory protein